MLFLRSKMKSVTWLHTNSFGMLSDTQSTVQNGIHDQFFKCLSLVSLVSLVLLSLGAWIMRLRILVLTTTNS